MALVAILSGCLGDILGPGTIGPPNDGGGYCYYQCVDLGIQPASSAQNILAGDSLMVYSHSSKLSNVSVTWSTTSPGVTFRSGNTTGPTVTSLLYSNVFVKSTTLGKVNITVASTNPSYTADMSFIVADSAAITYLRILGSTTQVKAANTLYLSSTLKDSSGNEFRGSPTWTSLDPSVLTLIPEPSLYYNAGSVTAQGKKAGSARVVASFRNLSDTLLVSVIP